ncbi:MAG: secondary thiamine-phosphate synthase enzyme YjbQ [Aigarchaeota archaeon]|nr:secondary thiamine-phosphate synthase enzyme YjbQ [Candidatus Bathyarchaeota archaeon]MDH5703970.1 secondary thiamine-phosphate synthase enzyme YjbQ [Aigarchaeota archaeon]
MKFHTKNVSVKTDKKLEILDVTSDISRIVEESGFSDGLVNLWVPHSTAAVAINEHDIDLWEDILSTMERLVPVKGDYRHNAKYGWSSREQNAHAHILNCMIKPDVNIPLQGGRLQLGTWQSILFIELDGPRSRSIRVQVMGEQRSSEG